MVAVNLRVETPEKIDRVQVFTTSVWVGYPLAFFSGVVEIQHRGDSIYAQPVDVVALEPEHRTAEKKASNLVAAIVEDIAVPIFVNAFTRDGMFVQVCPVEVA